MRIFVGNISFNTGDADLRDAFSAYGEVESAQVVMDRETQRSRGFGFVGNPRTETFRHLVQRHRNASGVIGEKPGLSTGANFEAACTR